MDLDLCMWGWKKLNNNSYVIYIFPAAVHRVIYPVPYVYCATMEEAEAVLRYLRRIQHTDARNMGACVYEQ